MNNTFNDDYTVGYSDLDNRRLMKPSKITDCFQQLATLHSAHAGYPVQKLTEMGIGWILLFWHIKIDRCPEEYEDLKIHTWSEMFRKIQANRDFCMTDSTGREIVYASSRWVLMDLEKRRPYRMPKGFYDTYLVEDSREVAEEKYDKITAPEGVAYTERVFRVNRRDTDTNSHVNNIIYIDWAVDDIPDEIYDEWDIVDIKAAYKKECLKGDMVRSRCYVVKQSEGDDNSEIEFISIFSKEDDDSVEYCQIVTKWVKG